VEDPCDEGGTDLTVYLSRADVKNALHVDAAQREGSSDGWHDCGGSFGRHVQYTRIAQDERLTVRLMAVFSLQFQQVTFNPNRFGRS